MKRFVILTVLFLGSLSLWTSNSMAQQGWYAQSSGTTNSLFGVFFTDANTGTAVGSEETILRTTDGGTTWTLQLYPEGDALYGVYFTDANTGTVVGGSDECDCGLILHTTDGGTNWTYQSFQNNNYDGFRAVSFTDANTGTIVGDNGWMFRTTDGGTSWTQHSSGTTNDLFGVSFTDANTGTAVGRGGLIFRTTTGGTTWVQEGRTSQIPNQFTLAQNYPNPFNPSTTIEFLLPRSGYVRLQVFNILGEVVATLVNEELNVGTYATQWNAKGVASGIYFYRMQVGNPSLESGQSLVASKKLLLLR